MKLDFSIFSQPAFKTGGQWGTWGTINVHAGSRVPPPVVPSGDTRDTFSGAQGLSPLSPPCLSSGGTESHAIHNGVPLVPLVPFEQIEKRLGTPVYDPETPARPVPQTLQPPEPDEFDPLDPLRPLFTAWFDANVQLDAKTVALRQHPQWSAGVNSLYSNHCGWMFDHHQGPVPPTLPEFRHLLQELCFEIRIIYGEEYVPNITLREDAEAAQAIRGCSPLR
jgi:hypothetical protein